MTKQDTAYERDIAQVRNVGGWAALVIGALTSNGVSQALATVLSGTAPKLGLSQSEAIINAFTLTAPLSVTAMAAAFVLFRGWIPDSGNAALALAAVLVVGGLIAGSLIYQVLGTTIEQSSGVEATSLTEALQRAPGTIQHKVAAFLFWIIAGYYQIFGPAHFAAGVIAGGFAAYAADKLAFRRS